jgi:hypothetical protein
MKKTILKDDNRKSLEVDLKLFLDHLEEYHEAGTSIHTQSGCSFTVDGIPLDDQEIASDQLREIFYYHLLKLFFSF